ncbi:hypothetical protein [Streptomyces sp. NPDC054883]
MSDYPPPQAGEEEPAPAAEAVTGSGDTPVTAVGDDGLRTLLQTAVACRPLDEVADLVTLLRRSGQVPDAANEALRAAAVSRPVEDVVSLALLLSEDHEEAPAPQPDRIGHDGEAGRRGSGKRGARAKKQDEPRAPRPAGAPGRGLRWPAVAALSGSALLYLPRRPSRLMSEGGAGTWLLLGVAAVCLALAVGLVVRDRTRVWAAAALTCLGILSVHALAAMTGLSPLGGAVGGLLPWSTGFAVLLAVLGAALAGMALLYRSEEPAPAPALPEPVVAYSALDALDTAPPAEHAAPDPAEAETTAP